MRLDTHRAVVPAIGATLAGLFLLDASLIFVYAVAIAVACLFVLHLAECVSAAISCTFRQVAPVLVRHCGVASLMACARVLAGHAADSQVPSTRTSRAAMASSSSAVLCLGRTMLSLSLLSLLLLLLLVVILASFQDR